MNNQIQVYPYYFDHYKKDFLIVNMVGEYVFISHNDFEYLVSKNYIILHFSFLFIVYFNYILNIFVFFKKTLVLILKTSYTFFISYSSILCNKK